MPRLSTPLPLNGSNPATPGDQVPWLGDDRSFQELRKATRLFEDRGWRKQNHFTKAKAVSFLQKRYPQLRGCPLNMEQLAEVFEVFPDRADWAARDFDPQRLWNALNDPEQQQARKQAARAERQSLLEDSRQFVAQTLKDRLLLAIRGGAWRPVNDLVQVVQELAPVGLAARRFIASGGADFPATVQETRGTYLLLDDALVLCCREQLAEVRTNQDEREVRSTPRQDSRFDVCPLFRDLLPRSASEDKRLEELLLIEGCRDPLVVWGTRRLLIDGHQRFSLCSLVGRPYPIVQKEFQDDAEACQYIWDLHYGRRSYNELLKSHVRGKHYLALRQGRGGDRRSKGPKCNPCTLKKDVAQAVARQYGVDRKTIYNDARFVRALDRIVAAGGEALRAAILSCRIKGTYKSQIEELAKKDEGEIKRQVAQALEEGRWPLDEENGEQTHVRLNLPLRQLDEQAAVLIKGLGKKAARRLCRRVLAKLRPSKATSMEPERPEVNGAEESHCSSLEAVENGDPATAGL